MPAYLLRRIVAMVPTLLGITFVTFLIMTLAPGDPVSTRLEGAEGSEGGASRERLADTIRAKKKLLGMVREAHAPLAWELPAAPAGAPADEPRVIALEGPLGTLEAWPRALALDGRGGLWAGDAEGGLTRLRLDGGSESLRVDAGDDSLLALVVDAAGGRVFAGDGGGRVSAWSAEGEAAWSAAISPLPVRDLALLPSGRILAASDDGAITVLGADGVAQARWTGHVGGVRALVPSADGATAWSGGADRAVREWDVASGTVRRVVHEGGAVNDLALHPGGATLFVAGEDRRAWSVPLTGGEAREIGRHGGPITAITLSADGRTLLTGGADEIVRAWDVAAGRVTAQTETALGSAAALVLADGRLVTASDSWLPVGIARRYLAWLSRLVRLDFDRSFKDDRPVMEKLGEALKVTLGLNVLALLLIYAIAVPLGVLAAARRGTTFDHVSSAGLFILYSIPNFWLATILILAFSSRTAWDVLPAVGLHSPEHRDLSYLAWLADSAKHLVLPLAVMTYGGFASLSRYARTSMLETIGQDFVRTARAKGLSERVVLWKHAFRNSLVTIVTLVGNLLPAMIGGSVIVESIFSIEGMGKLGFEAILARDYPVVMAITTFSALLTLLGILLSDVLYTVVDPRITHR